MKTSNAPRLAGRTPAAKRISLAVAGNVVLALGIAATLASAATGGTAARGVGRAVDGGVGRAVDRAVGEPAAATTASDTRHFPRAEGPRSWTFPRDHGSHPAYRTEWWYFTGSLRLVDATAPQREDADRLGFELTFFRVALRPDRPAGASRWRTRDLILSHFAVTDVAGRRFLADERAQRAAAGLAGASPQELHVWSGAWEARRIGDDLRLRASARKQGTSFAIDLLLDADAPVLLHGENGWTAKDSTGRMASYYYSMPSLGTRGRVTLDGRPHAVEGTTWMDHEFFSGAGTPGGGGSLRSGGDGESGTTGSGLGWDWFGARFDDGSAVMLYRMRHPGGEVFTLGTRREADGRIRSLRTAGFTATPLAHWQSPETHARYPIGWRLVLPREEAVLTVRALLPQPEVVARQTVGFAYWEGLSHYGGRWAGRPVEGEGYVELTGYARMETP